jgi:hypothetical protein
LIAPIPAFLWPLDSCQLDQPRATGFECEPVPGASSAAYEIVRGDLAALSGDASGVDLGTLTCIEAAASGASYSSEAEVPPPGSIWFYLVRFNLGLSSGEWGSGSDGGLRSGTEGCGP